MDFEARLFDPVSRAVKLRHVQAANEAAARALLAEGGGTVLVLRSTRRTRAAAEPAKRHDLALWCRELRALLQAGLSVVEALDALAAAAGPSSIMRPCSRGCARARPCQRRCRTSTDFRHCWWRRCAPANAPVT